MVARRAGRALVHPGFRENKTTWFEYLINPLRTRGAVGTASNILVEVPQLGRSMSHPATVFEANKASQAR